MRINLLEDSDLRRTEIVEDPGVLLDRQHGAVRYPSAECRLKWLLRCDVEDEPVRDVTVVRRNLHSDLPVRTEGAEEARQERAVIVDPLDRRVGDDEVPGAGKVGEVPLPEVEVGVLDGLGAL